MWPKPLTACCTARPTYYRHQPERLWNQPDAEYRESGVSNGLQGGNPYAAGNPIRQRAGGLAQPESEQVSIPRTTASAPRLSPFIFFDPHNRPGRVFTWSIGVQREVMKNLVVEVSYVGNRGAYFPAPYLDQIASNSLTPQCLLSQFGINMNSNAANNCTSPGVGCQTDRQLLLDL